MNTSVVCVSLCAAWQGIATILNVCARASVARRTSCGEPHAGVPNGLKKKQPEALAQKDERDSRA